MYYHKIMTKLVHDSELPTPGQQVITVCALIHRTRKGRPEVFMPRRSMKKRFMPGVYNLPGGHLDFGEEPVVGLQREIREEFGMELSVGEPFAAFTYTNHIKGSHSVEIIYFAQFTSLLDHMSMEPEDHTDFRWVSLDTIADVYSELKDANNPEMVVLRRGLELLGGASLNLG